MIIAQVRQGFFGASGVVCKAKLSRQTTQQVRLAAYMRPPCLRIDATSSAHRVWGQHIGQPRIPRWDCSGGNEG